MIKKNSLIMGILNVTPDSFSDGGQYLSLTQALEQAEKMIKEGADIIDVGGESTRPNAKPVPVEEERKRVIPVIEAILKKHPVLVSVDTSKSEIAKEALSLGAHIINDVTAGSDTKMPSLIAEKKATVVLMHMKGDPRTMQADPIYPDGVVCEVKKTLSERIEIYRKAGVPFEKIWIDPGIGFGKTVQQNLELLKQLSEFSDLAERILIGTSRKSFLSKVAEHANLIKQREAGTLASNLWALQMGASVFRVHKVGEMKRAMQTWNAIQWLK